MLPTFLDLGMVVISSLNVLLALGLVVGLFVFWRKGKEEHYDELDLFDGIFLGQLVGILAARIGFILLHFDRFYFNPIAWLDIFSHPGFNLTVFLVVSGYYLFVFSRRKKWDAYEIMDFWVASVSVSMIFVWLGYFLAGSSFGTPTALPVGMVFPGVFEKHHPVQLYYVVFYMLLAWYLAWVEYRYRTFAWYRKNRNTAQTGFLFAVFLVMVGLVHSLMSFISFSTVVLFGIRVDVLLSVAMTFFGLGLLFIRSGRTLLPSKKKVRAKKIEQLKVQQ